MYIQWRILNIIFWYRRIVLICMWKTINKKDNAGKNYNTQKKVSYVHLKAIYSIAT